MKKSLLSPAYASLILAVTALSGCTAIQRTPEPQAPVQSLPSVEIPLEYRSYHSSWGHSGRGGAALRKPAYQHVLSTQDQLDTAAGRLYPPPMPPAAVTAIAAPPFVSQLPGNHSGDTSLSAPAAAIVFPLEGSTDNCQQNTGVRVLAREPVNEYIRVHNKLCAGVERLTYEEWQVLVNSTPKDVPSNLKTSPIKPATQGEPAK